MACSDPKPVCEAGAELGEGPLWDARDKALWFVDIKGDAVHRYDPADHGRRVWKAPGQVCVPKDCVSPQTPSADR